MKEWVTISQISDRLGMPGWKVSQLRTRGAFPEPTHHTEAGAALWDYAVIRAWQVEQHPEAAPPTMRRIETR